MNGCCMKHAHGEEYPGQHDEGSHDSSCYWYWPDGSEKGPEGRLQRAAAPAWAPLPPGFREAHDREVAQRSTTRLVSTTNFRMTRGNDRLTLREF